MRLFAPVDSLMMRVVRQTTPLKLEPGISTDECVMLVRDAYRRPRRSQTYTPAQYSSSLFLLGENATGNI